MKFHISILLFLTSFIALAQTKTELLPNGRFNPVEGKLPQMTDEKFIEGTQLWIQEFSRGEYDITEVAENSLTIDAFRDNAFLYTNLGERFLHKVKYQLKIAKKGNAYTASFQVTEIHIKKTILETTLADYFTPDGKIKEGFEEVKPSMDRTVNLILASYDNYIGNFRP